MKICIVEFIVKVLNVKILTFIFGFNYLHMKNLYFFFAVSLCFINSFGQQSKVDVLKNNLNKESDDIKKLEILDDLKSELWNINIDEYILYVDSMHVISKKINNKAYTAQSLLSKGLYQSKMYNNKKALQLMKESLKHYEDIDSIKKSSDVIGNIGQVYQHMGIIDSAKFYLNKSIEMCLRIENHSRLFYNYYSLAVYESRISNNKIAIDFLFKALESANKAQNKGNIAHANSMLGVIYEDQEFYNKAEEKYNESLTIFKELDNIYGMAGQYGHLASLHASRDFNYTKSNIFYQKAIQNYKKVGALESICISQYNIGRNYLNENKIDSARYYLYASYNLGKKINSDYGLAGVLSDIAEVEFKSKNYKKAEKLLEQSLKGLQGQDYIYERSKALIVASEIYSAQNKYKKAYDSYVEGKDIKDSLFSLERSSKILEVETKYQTEKKEKENLLLKADNVEQELLIQKANTRNWILVLGLLAVSISTFFIWRRYKSEAKAKQTISKQKNQIEKLQREFHHRLKNDFRSINSFIRLAQKKFSETKFQERLNELKNRVTSMFKVHELLLEQNDITHVKAKPYLIELSKNLEKKYNNSNIILNCNVDETEIIMADKAVPFGIILNEFVTNSYKHAFDDNGGEISVDFYSDVHNHYLTLRDNGKGLPKDFDDKNLRSFGMEIMPLLAHQYDGEFELNDNNGVSITVTLPKQIA